MELSIDTASPDRAGIGLSEHGVAVAEFVWRTRSNHSVELLPNVAMLLERLGARKEDLTAVFVCTGPGSYAGLRVGVSAAKAMAYGLGLALAGVGRLELDAYVHAARPGPLLALHQAGRGEAAWAVYEGPPERWRETTAPRMSRLDAVAAAAPAGSFVCGDLRPELAEQLAAAGFETAASAAAFRRPSHLAELGWRRLQRGLADDPRRLAPLYLRAPAIGPQA